jgi:GAF domain-containing protein
MDRCELPPSNSAQQSTQEIFQHVAQGVLERLNLAVVGVWLLDSSSRVLQLHASAGYGGCLEEDLFRVPTGALPIGRVALGRVPVRSDELLADQDPATQRFARSQGLQSFVGCPLLADGRVRGVLGGFDFLPLPPTALDYLRSVAWPMAALLGSTGAPGSEPDWSREASAERRLRSARIMG